MMADRARSDARALRALLTTQSEQVAEGTLQAGGRVSSDRLDELTRLGRLVEMREAAARASRTRWAVPVVAVITMVCTSALLFARVRSTEVELELKVSEFSFVMPELRAITNALSVAELAVSGLRGIDLHGAEGVPAAAGTAGSISLAADRGGRRPGSVGVEPIIAPSGARVWLRALDDTRRYGMTIRGLSSGLAVSTDGRVRLIVPGALNEVRDFAFPRRIDLMTDSQQVSIEFTPSGEADRRHALQSPLPAKSLFLNRLDRFQLGNQSLVREVPTIQSGTLYFESLNGEARPLRAGEALNLAWSTGEMRRLQLDEDGILLRFHGTVGGMTTGSDDVERSLMPTWLEWLRARHALGLLWGTTAYVVGSFVTILGWWRRPS